MQCLQFLYRYYSFVLVLRQEENVYARSYVCRYDKLQSKHFALPVVRVHSLQCNCSEYRLLLRESYCILTHSEPARTARDQTANSIFLPCETTDVRSFATQNR